MPANSLTGSSFLTAEFDSADLDLPNLISLAQLLPERYPFLLESVAAGPDLARFDILFGFPGETLTLGADGSLSGPGAADENDFLRALDLWWSEDRVAEIDTELPFTGGWFLFLGYELAQQIEPSLQLTNSESQPVAFATRVPLAIIRDAQTGRCTVVAEAGHEEDLQRALDDLRNTGMHAPARSELPEFAIVEDDPEHFLLAVDAAKQYITEGDVFQANLSRCWRVNAESELNPVELYLRLRQSNPSPFGGLLQLPDFALISSSPERLVRRRGRRVDTRPIAGTRARSAETQAIDLQKRELLGHPKERAEHIMLIDLERNDLGRVCEGGSVKVDEYMVIESYSHVHHIVSNVTGTARENLLPGQLIRAVFPGGTITGCPKVRCMQIIHELEQRPRGAYTGSMGYLNRNGDCDLNILIRTMSVSGKQMEIAAGSGIVADSEPHHELEETRAKAKGLLMALRTDS